MFICAFFSYGLLIYRVQKHGFSFTIPPTLIVSFIPPLKTLCRQKNTPNLYFLNKNFWSQYLPLPHSWPQFCPIACNTKGWLCQSNGGAKWGEVFGGIISCVTMVTSPPISPTSNSYPQTLPDITSHWNAFDVDKGSRATVCVPIRSPPPTPLRPTFYQYTTEVVEPPVGRWLCHPLSTLRC